MTKQQALDALYAVLVDGISADDISFTEEEHTQAVLAWNYFNKQGSGERNRWLAAVDEEINGISNKLWDSLDSGADSSTRTHLQEQRKMLEELKARMTEGGAGDE